MEPIQYSSLLIIIARIFILFGIGLYLNRAFIKSKSRHSGIHFLILSLGSLIYTIGLILSTVFNAYIIIFILLSIIGMLLYKSERNKIK